MNTPALIIVAMEEPRGVKAIAVNEIASYGPVPRLAEVMRLSSAPGKAKHDSEAPKKSSRWDSLLGIKHISVPPKENAQGEEEQQVSRETALRIETLLRHYHPQTWALAAPETMSESILRRLTPKVRQSLSQVIRRDLGALDPAGIMDEFVGDDEPSLPSR